MSRIQKQADQPNAPGLTANIPMYKRLSTNRRTGGVRNPQPPAVNFPFDMFSSTARSLRLRHTRLPVANTVATLAGAAGAAAFFHNTSFRSTAKMAETKDAFSPKVREVAALLRVGRGGRACCLSPSRGFPVDCLCLDTAPAVGILGCVSSGTGAGRMRRAGTISDHGARTRPILRAHIYMHSRDRRFVP